MPSVKSNLNGLEKIIKNFKKDIVVRVGIIGSDAKAQHDNKSGLTNAQLGSVHEFGADINHPGGTPYYINTSTGMGVFVKKDSSFGKSLIDKGQTTGPHNIKIPARSFLEQPLKEKLNFKNPEMKKSIFKNYFKKNTPEQYLKDLGAQAVDIVQEAFNTNGFGQWKELTAGTKRQKAKKGYSPNSLITSGQGGLRSTIDFKVIKND